MPNDVGIVMPVYRQKSRFLREALTSILKQSYHRFRLVVVLDGSPGHTKRLVRKLVHGDKRVRVISLPQNGGIANALNCGFEALYQHSRIRYLTWVSSDNVYHRDFIRQLRHTIRRAGTHTGLVHSAFGFINDEGAHVFTPDEEIQHSVWMHQSKEKLLDVCFIGASFLYKRRHAERTGQYGCEPVEDYDFWLRLTEHCDLAYTPKFLMDYRTNSEYSISRQLHGNQDEHRRWRFANEATKLAARNRRGIAPELTVVVPLHSPAANSIAGLESLYEQSMSNLQIVVVDTVPGSDASRMAQAISDPRVNCIEARGLDLRRAIRLGASHASASAVLIYPPAAELNPHHVSQVYENYHAGSAIGSPEVLSTLAGRHQFPTYVAWPQSIHPTATLH